MKRAAIVVTTLAGAALFEAALVPGVLIGAACLLAPGILARGLVGVKRENRPKPEVTTTRAVSPPAAEAATGRDRKVGDLPPLTLKQTFLKTITFRAIVTSLDFGSNLFVIGELAPAAGLSAYGLIAGPFFYFVHEILWNRRDSNKDPVLRGTNEQVLSEPQKIGGRFHMSRALAKTITYRAFATTADFSANYFVVRDFATAAGLTSFGFIVGPFVYYGHEKLWDHMRGRQGLEFHQGVDGSGPEGEWIPQPAIRVETAA